MAFVRNHRKELEVPHEPGNFITIRRPLRSALRDASRARQIDALQRMRDLGGPSFLAELEKARDKKDTDTTTATVEDDVNPADAYDQDALLNAGIVAWRGPQYDDMKVGAEAIAELDEVTAAWAARQIAEYAQGKESQEKNG